MDAAQFDLLLGLEPVLGALLAEYKTVEQCWQPSELLPDLTREDWPDEVRALRAEAARLGDDVLVLLVGNIVTEEALPSYQTALNRFAGMTDATGTETHAWARWSRAWTAEEQRHGSVTSTYLYLTGRVNLRAVEDTIQNLIRNGFDPRAGGDAYRGLAYVSFQERATKLCWTRLAKRAAEAGAPRLQRICGQVGADEARHERVYQTLLQHVVARAPEPALAALHDIWGHVIEMPARTMTDGRDRRLFEHFADLNQRTGVYTLADYAEILTHVVDAVGLPRLTGLSGEAAAQQEALCALPERFRALAQERQSRPSRAAPFAWIHGRSA